MEKPSRNQVIDLIKGLAIFTVVLGHCIQYGSGSIVLENQSFYDNYLFKLIYSFHMPVFMLVSGYLFSMSIQKYSTYELAQKAIKTLLIPIVLWVLLYRIPEMVISYDGTDSLIKAIIKLISYIVTGFWFLWAIFFFQIFTLCVKKWLLDSVWVYLITFTILLFIPDLMITQLYKYMYPYFYLGYFSRTLIKNSNLIEKFRRYGWLFILLTIVLLPLFNYRTYIYNNTITLMPNGYETYFDQVKNIVLRYGIGIVGSLGSIWLCAKINSMTCLNCIKEVLVVLGKNSLGIYIISGYIVSLIVVPTTANLSPSFGILGLEAMLVTVTSILLTSVIQKIPFLNKYLLGGR